MNLINSLRVVGCLLLLLGVSHTFFNRFLGWAHELQCVSLLTRQIFYVHTFFIGLAVVLAGAVSLFYADALTRPGALSRAILAGLAAFVGAAWLSGRLRWPWRVRPAAVLTGVALVWLAVKAAYVHVLVPERDLTQRGDDDDDHLDRRPGCHPRNAFCHPLLHVP